MGVCQDSHDPGGRHDPFRQQRRRGYAGSIRRRRTHHAGRVGLEGHGRPRRHGVAESIVDEGRDLVLNAEAHTPGDVSQRRRYAEMVERRWRSEDAHRRRLSEDGRIARQPGDHPHRGRLDAAGDRRRHLSILVGRTMRRVEGLRTGTDQIEVDTDSRHRCAEGAADEEGDDRLLRLSGAAHTNCGRDGADELNRSRR